MGEPLDDLIEALDDMYVKKLAPDKEITDQLTANLKALGVKQNEELVCDLTKYTEYWSGPSTDEGKEPDDLAYCISELEALVEQLKSRKR